jgi:hypothetical protein
MLIRFGITNILDPKRFLPCALVRDAFFERLIHVSKSVSIQYSSSVVDETRFRDHATYRTT